MIDVCFLSLKNKLTTITNCSQFKEFDKMYQIVKKYGLQSKVLKVDKSLYQLVYMVEHD